MKEQWKLIDGFEDYEVSNLGRIKSYKNNEENILSLNFNNTGYGYATLYGDDRVQFRIHRLVAEAFIPNPNNKPQVNHLDGDKTNNRVDNLEWCTHKENIKHAIENGLFKGFLNLDGHIMRGELHKDTKFSKEDVLYIRDLYKNTDINQYEIADLYGVAQSTIERIVNRKNWKHI